MGYRIVYGEEPPVQRPRSRLRLLTAAFGLAFLVLVGSFWPGGRALLRQVLLPGAGEAALQQMAEQIRAGEPVGEAVTAFCRDVVAHALEDPA